VEIEAAAPDAEGADQGAETGPDLGRFMEEFAGFRGDLTSRLDGLTGRLDKIDQPAADEGEDESADDGFDLDAWLREQEGEQFDDEGELTPEAQQQALQAIIRSEIEKAQAPERARQQEQRRAQDADALEEKYPELADDKVSNAIIGQGQQLAAALAEQTGQPALAELWREPALIELIYKAGKASDAAESQREPGDEVQLERGSSVPASRNGNEQDPGDAIVKAAQRSHFRLGRV
jgi:hypothetical protein